MGAMWLAVGSGKSHHAGSTSSLKSSTSGNFFLRKWIKTGSVKYLASLRPIVCLTILVEFSLL